MKSETHFKALLLGCAAIGATTSQASTDYGPAIWNPLPSGYYYTSGYGHKFLVIHDMEGYYANAYAVAINAGGTAHYSVNGKKDSSSDSPAGEIMQFVRESNYAIHARCWNTHSAGTEHEGFASNPAWYTDDQYIASAHLNAHMCNVYGIPKDRNHVVGHGEKSNSAWVSWANSNLPGVDPTCNTHTDPGPYWNWSKYMNLMQPNAKPGVFRGAGDWNFRTSLSGGSAELTPSYGTTGDIPVFGDWDGDGIATPGVFRVINGEGWWYLRNSVLSGGSDYTFQFGAAGDLPVVGDWDGDGKWGIGVFRGNGEWFLRNSLVSGVSDYNFTYGQTGDKPVAGDWNGDGPFGIGVYRGAGDWYLRNALSAGGSSYNSTGYGIVGDVPVAGDWDGNGTWSIGVVRNQTTWYLRNSKTSGASDYTFNFGATGDKPVVWW